jgi:RNA polymerase sigma-70 factor, ECF subfamily
VSLALRPQPAASCFRRDETRRIDDVRAIGSAVARLSGGEEDAFRSLIEPHRPALHAHCYRMLGSMHDAEDALQETLLRAWRALPKFRGRSSLRSWLHRIATNVCLDAIARRPKRGLPIDYRPATRLGGDGPMRPLSSALWIEPYSEETLGSADGEAAPEARYERREALELAFVATLQHLPPRKRAVLILRDVLGFSAKEVAEVLMTTVASVNGALQRARRALDERRPERSQQAALRSLRDTRVRNLVDRFANAFETGDVGAILTLLAEDATFAAPRTRRSNTSQPTAGGSGASRRPWAPRRRPATPSGQRQRRQLQSAAKGDLRDQGC